MSRKDRDSLKNAFHPGAQPSAEDFADLIDSALNMADDGFEKSDRDGFKIAQSGKTGSRLLSFFEKIAVGVAAWTVRLGQGRRRLLLCDESDRPVLALDQTGKQGRVGINKEDPEHALDVDGVVACTGRSGRRVRVPADGEWQQIAGPLDGCHAYEVVAGAGDRDKGRYALLHALAINAFNRNGHVTRHQSHCGSRCDQLDLRWHGSAHEYRLEIRTRCAYGGRTAIQVFVTDLWFDESMGGCDTGTP